VIGYDTRFHKYSPGSVLLYVIIQKIFAEGTFKYLDFGEDGSWYKEFWSTGVVRCARGYYFPMVIPIISAVLMHVASNAVSDLLGTVLATFGLRHTVRRILRQRVFSGAKG
jgi:CelD/BcsL family acetyltransferase involved in cellulose biosynthesis